MFKSSSAIVAFPDQGSARKQRLIQLQAVHEVTRAMISHAEEGSWDKVGEMQSRRAGMLKDALSAPFGEADEEGILSAEVMKLQAQNTALMALVSTEKLKLKEQVNTVGQQHQAAQTYLA